MANEPNENGSGVGLTLRELVLEVREDVKAVRDEMPSKEVQTDHEFRIRKLETKIVAFAAAAVVAGGALGKAVSSLGVF